MNPIPHCSPQSFAQYGVPANTIGGQDPPSRPPGKVIITTGQPGGGDDNDSTMSLDSDEEQEAHEKIRRVKERRLARRSRRVEMSPTAPPPPDDRPASHPAGTAPANPNDDILIVMQHRYTRARAGNSERATPFKRTGITPPTYTGSAEMDLRAWLTSLKLYLDTNQWMWKEYQPQISFACSLYTGKAHD